LLPIFFGNFPKPHQHNLPLTLPPMHWMPAGAFVLELVFLGGLTCLDGVVCFGGVVSLGGLVNLGRVVSFGGVVSDGPVCVPAGFDCDAGL
jgi:hypothetical protein